MQAALRACEAALAVGYNGGTWNSTTPAAITTTSGNASNFQGVGYLNGSDYATLRAGATAFGAHHRGPDRSAPSLHLHGRCGP